MNGDDPWVSAVVTLWLFFLAWLALLSASVVSATSLSSACEAAVLQSRRGSRAPSRLLGVLEHLPSGSSPCTGQKPGENGESPSSPLSTPFEAKLQLAQLFAFGRNTLQ